jgi:hypothetical protein
VTVTDFISCFLLRNDSHKVILYPEVADEVDAGCGNTRRQNVDSRKIVAFPLDSRRKATKFSPKNITALDTEHITHM